ncbi:HEPN domain-containing protein [Hoeflea alexandrii]
MAELNLTYVDELISVRQIQHGGARGAPKRVEDGSREGASINRSSIVLLSALLQSYVQEVFETAAKQALPALAADDVWTSYWKQMKSWGNPSAENTKTLFLKIGIHDVFDGLSWQKCDNSLIRSRLNQLNHVRNSIAHGAAVLRVNDVDYFLTLQKVKTFRNFAEAFADRFEDHVMAKL